jgi:hypothetical protein
LKDDDIDMIYVRYNTEPLSTMQAVYLITLCEGFIQALMADFSNSNRSMCRAAHVCFTEGQVCVFSIVFFGWIDGWIGAGIAQWYITWLRAG